MTGLRSVIVKDMETVRDNVEKIRNAYKLRTISKAKFNRLMQHEWETALSFISHWNIKTRGEKGIEAIDFDSYMQGFKEAQSK